MPPRQPPDQAARAAAKRREETQNTQNKMAAFFSAPENAQVVNASAMARNQLVISQPGVTQNPPFIYPGETFHDLSRTRGRPTKIERGYIRRLTEFYQKMDNPPAIYNRKCNFQFQPETIVRSVSANAYDTQFFFNQDPAQLSVPIPGQASYGFKLLFNREAEVYSKKYKNNSGSMVKAAFDVEAQLKKDPEYFINQQWSPDWVCGLGALADIMMLDSVIGQGFNSEMLQIVKSTLAAQAAKAAANPSTPPEQNKDEEDKTQTDTTYIPEWSDQSLNPNLGNTAFLTPVPVRVYLSKWMIIEGFITASTVNFVKFTPRYIPTVATVELQMQALYIGFDKKQTMLTSNIPVDPTSSTGTPDNGSWEDEYANSGSAEKDKVIKEQTQQGIDNFFKSTTDQGDDRDSLNDIVFTNTEGSFNAQFGAWILTNAGDDFRKTFQTANGGDVKFYAEGVIKVWWHAYAKGAAESSRGTTKLNKPSGSTITKVDYSKELPPEIANLTHWGTQDNPLIIRADGEIEWTRRTAQRDQYNTNFTGWQFTRPSPTYKVPFEEEQFNVEFEISISAIRYGVTYISKQKAVAKYILRADKDDLFNNITIVNNMTLNDFRQSERNT